MSIYIKECVCIAVECHKFDRYVPRNNCSVVYIHTHKFVLCYSPGQMISLLAISLRDVFSHYRHSSRPEGLTGTTNPSSEGGLPYNFGCQPV